MLVCAVKPRADMVARSGVMLFVIASGVIIEQG